VDALHAKRFLQLLDDRLCRGKRLILFRDNSILRLHLLL
jgi:hypothetical protein